MSVNCQSSRGDKYAPIWYTLLKGGEIRSPCSDDTSDDEKNRQLVDLHHRTRNHSFNWKFSLASGFMIGGIGGIRLRMNPRNRIGLGLIGLGTGIMTIGTSYNVRRSMQYRDQANKLIESMKTQDQKNLEMEFNNRNNKTSVLLLDDSELVSFCFFQLF